MRTEKIAEAERVLKIRAAKNSILTDLLELNGYSVLIDTANMYALKVPETIGARMIGQYIDELLAEVEGIDKYLKTL